MNQVKDLAQCVQVAYKLHLRSMITLREAYTIKQ